FQCHLLLNLSSLSFQNFHFPYFIVYYPLNFTFYMLYLFLHFLDFQTLHYLNLLSRASLNKRFFFSFRVTSRYSYPLDFFYRYFTYYNYIHFWVQSLCLLVLQSSKANARK
ncbi:hypothetical protein GIB67_010098, partial [Kingdonia uniflora]